MSIRPALQRGITLIEQIVFIVIVSVGVMGLVSVMNPAIRASADPMLTKQLVAIAESLLNEVMHQPFTWCDPDDPAASTAQSYAACASPQNTNTTASFSGGESRLGVGPDTPYDNVSDYGGQSWANISDPSGGNVMTGYTASVAVARAGTALGLADDTAALSVTVTVTRGTETFSLTGYRFRYAPRI
ncbi:type IV pilus modification PilV family protein [Ferribacterium limneticum]|uniref:type IV pilus modification PilV family protein n=1 Tax=Ferribacterium limneticum TaxID=76259 RepID=UPI001CFA3D4D|nr:type II secretion system protein [Ferribacterium limneticum]UCV19882.1 type II secretion system protein [Ferribacterium limneticum]